MLISGALNILKQANCPYLTTEEEWWVEKLIYEKSPTRTDLLLWIISKLSNSQDAETDESLTLGRDFSLVSCGSSTPSSQSAVPATDEGILKFLHGNGFCVKQGKDFVSGDIAKEKQRVLWTCLLNALKNITVSSTNVTQNVLGFLTDTTSAENFLDLFKMKASLLPPDLDQEIKNRITSGKLPSKPKDLQENLQRIEKATTASLPTKSYPVMQADMNSMTQSLAELKETAQAFQECYLHELKLHYTTTPSVSPEAAANVDAAKLGKAVQRLDSNVSVLHQGVNNRVTLQALNEELKCAATDLPTTQRQMKIHQNELELLEAADRNWKESAVE